MKLELTLVNCFWLVVPLLVWNIAFGSKITQEAITSDAHSPAWLLGAENIFRIITFVLPLLLRMRIDDHLGKIGLAIYGIGTLIYFASWIPLMTAPQSAWSQSIAGLFAPRITPWIALLGVAFVAHSWIYGSIATVFIFFHTWHGIQNLHFDDAQREVRPEQT
jgi:hypothetical protein